jgi:hypothetical protein
VWKCNRQYVLTIRGLRHLESSADARDRWLDIGNITSAAEDEHQILLEIYFLAHLYQIRGMED